jgi:DNA uptake protein ComE-like DNA-binding protein
MPRTASRISAAILATALTAAGTIAVSAQAGRRTDILDPNIAGEKELLAVPHLTPAIVKGLLEKRPFLSMTELNALLAGQVGTEQLGDVYRKMFVQINLNTATKEEILMIPGVGNRMLHEFEEYRPYKAMAQFRREIGKYVDDKEVARLEQYVFVPIDLNTASDEDILSIPGVGKRMLHEFKEYRPYKSIEQFRREIGKYVDKQEVARLERYVTIG